MKTMQRKLDSRLTHTIVVADGHWAKGASHAAAAKAFRNVRGAPLPTKHSVWAVTAETFINDLGRFVIPGEFVQPADITGEM